MVFGDILVLILTVIVSLIAISIGLMLGMMLETDTLMQNKYFVGEDVIDWTAPSGKNSKMYFRQIDSHKLSDKGLLLMSSSDKRLIPAQLPLFNELSAHILSQLNEKVLNI